MDSLQTTQIPADEDRTLGSADFVTLRLSIFKNTEMDLPLQRVLAALRDKDLDHWDYLCKPFRSFHDDIVVPHATESSLPLVILCEPFRDDEDGASVESRFRPPYHVKVEFSQEMIMDWEGEKISELFCSEGHSLSISAELVDCVTFFESGIIAYSLALMFGKTVDLNAQQLLAIGALVSSAGQFQEGAVKFRRGEGDMATSLPPWSFIRERLSTLASGRNMFGPVASDRTPFTFLTGWLDLIDDKIVKSERNRDRTERSQHKAELEGHREVAMQLKDSLGSFEFHARHESEKTAFPPDQLVSASIGIEVIGAQWHERVLDYAAKAGRREARVDDFSLRLAGLAQNVFDFRNQDSEEINDSLSSTALIGTDITFVQRGVSIRFMEKSRAFDQMRRVLGGSPYWLLVQMVLGHNERLLSSLNAELEELRQRYGLNGMIRERLVNTYTAEGRINEAVERLGRRFLRRMRLVHYIPNIFRYPTEQRHYQLFSQARGLEAQLEYLERLDTTIEQTLESTAREAISIGNRPFDIRLQLLLGTIGVLQIAGTLASLIAVWPKAGLWSCLWRGACEFTPDGSPALLWLAVAAIAISVVFIGLVATWLLRHRETHWQVPANAEQAITTRRNLP